MTGLVKIIIPQTGELQTSRGTRVEMADGTEIPEVSKIVINPLSLNEIITAEITVAVRLADIEAHPLLSLDSLREAAEAHGYELIERAQVSIRTLDDAATRLVPCKRTTTPK